MNKIRFTILLIVLTAAACGGAPSGPADPGGNAPGGPLSVYVVNYPLQYLAAWIGGDAVRVAFPAPPDVDPAYWAPDAASVAAYQAADLILLNGAGYAAWVDRVSLPRARLVDTSRSFRERYVPVVGDVTHTHGPAGEHSHGDAAHTTWLDPTQALEQARTVFEALVESRPDESEGFSERFAALQADLLALDGELTTVCAAIGDRPLLFSHPVYQYLIRRCDLNAVSLHWEPGDEPPDAEWRGLAETLQEHPARLMIWEGRPSDANASRLQSLGVEGVVFDPCSQRPDSGDFLSVMRAGLEALRSKV